VDFGDVDFGVLGGFVVVVDGVYVLVVGGVFEYEGLEY